MANTWNRDRGWVIAPSTARYARVVTHVKWNTALMTPQGGVPNIFFDHFRLSRALAKFTLGPAGTDKILPLGGTWTPHYLGSAVTKFDNTNSFTAGLPGSFDGYWTVPYDMEAAIFLKTATTTSLAAGKVMRTRVRANGTTTICYSGYHDSPGGTQPPNCLISQIVQLTKGDTLEVHSWQGDTVNKNTDESETRWAIQEVANAA